jgi:hypothetical protein
VVAVTDVVWARVTAGFGLALAAAVLVPRTGDEGDVPGLGLLLVTGVLVGLATTGALYLVLRRDLGLPASIALFAVGYNALVVLVKFVFSPEALYEHSEAGSFEAWFDPSETGEAIIISSCVFALYALALMVIYRVCRRRLVERRRSSWKRVVVIAILTAAALFATGGIPLLLLFGGLEYVDFVFSSAVSGLVALALAGAVALAAVAFRSAAERAQLVGDVALLVSVFWIGLAFLALYHALWVVYVLVLTAIWPLKVITPK